MDDKFAKKLTKPFGKALFDFTVQLGNDEKI